MFLSDGQHDAGVLLVHPLPKSIGKRALYRKEIVSLLSGGVAAKSTRNRLKVWLGPLQTQARPGRGFVPGARRLRTSARAFSCGHVRPGKFYRGVLACLQF